MHSVLNEYFEALERLKKGRPLNVPKGSKITNDNVSLEAGRKKGTIKKSRPVFKALIDAIDAAAAEKAEPENATKTALEAAKAIASRDRTLWEEAVAREISMFYQLEKAQQQWAKEKAALTGEKVTSINTKRLRGG
jgi:hypothetical protein